MNSLKRLLIGVCVALFASTAFAQFESKNSFPEGEGEGNRSYGLTLPEGVTVKIPDEDVVYKAGDTIMVPGKNITVIEVDDETGEPESEIQAKGFNSKMSIADPSQRQGKGVVAVLINITHPGVVVTAVDGRTATTGDTIMFYVLHETVQQTPVQDTPQETMKGFQSK